MSTTIVREPQYTIDTLLQLEDGAAAIVADGAGSAILDLGDARIRGDVVIDVSAITTGGASGETYAICAQFSSSATFASDVENGPIMFLGDEATVPGAAEVDVDSDAGRYILPVVNQLNTRQYRYMRLWVDVTGTAPSITFVAHLCKEKSI